MNYSARLEIARVKQGPFCVAESAAGTAERPCVHPKPEDNESLRRSAAKSPKLHSNYTGQSLTAPARARLTAVRGKVLIEKLILCLSST